MEESISSSRSTASAFFYAANSVHSAAPSDDSGWTAYFHDDCHLLPAPADQNKLHRHPHHGGDCATASTVSSASKMSKVKVKKGSEETKKRPRPEPEDPLQDTASSPLNATPFQQLQDGCHIAECEDGETVSAAATECRTRQCDHWDGPGAEKRGVCLISPCYSH